MTEASKPRRPTVRDRLLEAGIELFCRDGFMAVGVDAIIERAGVAKMSLYQNFGSKDGLIAAVLERRHHEWRLQFQEAVQRLAATPRAQLLAAFDALSESMARSDYRGCAFSNAVAELADPSHPARRVIIEHKDWLRDFFRATAEAAELADAAGVARTLLLLHDGAILSAVVERSTAGVAAARRAAEMVIQSAERPAAIAG